MTTRRELNSAVAMLTYRIRPKLIIYQLKTSMVLASTTGLKSILILLIFMELFVFYLTLFF